MSAAKIALRYSVEFGCGHPMKAHTRSSYPPTMAAVAKCDACGRHVPLVLRVER